jgi:hypothetical protein
MHLYSRLDFSKAGEDELEALYRTCKPATFGRNGENVLDGTYRKAGKMDLTAFSTLFDPRSRLPKDCLLAIAALKWSCTS